jgi:hypothetical protein
MTGIVRLGTSAWRKEVNKKKLKKKCMTFLQHISLQH